ncbi:MAG: diguanylate cyclase [Nautiliaceae bacterium]
MRILIADSDYIYLKLLKNYLEKYLVNVKCELVSSFKELKEKKLSDYELFITNISLPDVEESEHLEYILKHSDNVIVITKFEDSFLKSSLREQVIDYIMKEDIHSIEYLVKLIKRLGKNKDLNVLVVEDSYVIREHEKKILKKIRLNVFEAANGKEALDVLEKENINLLITDLVMPGMDGEQLIVRVREDYSMNSLPIIVISGNEDTNKFLKTLKLGANDYLKKPFLKEELMIRVNNLLDVYDNMRKIENQLKKDPLTEAYNRFYLEHILENAFNVYETKSIAMLDIDFFKKINDTYGHQIGDEILKHFVNTIKNSIRKSDVLVRYGGEEFLIFMPNTSKKEAAIVLYKIKKALEPYKDIRYTFSAGIADEGESLAEMIKIADERLYQSKEEGRDKITF